MQRSDFTPPASESVAGRPRGHRVAFRSWRSLLARALLALLLSAVAGFYVAIGVQDANPPVIAVQGGSVLPSLSSGDLALLQGVPFGDLRKGDIIAVAVPSALRARDQLPPDVERRIVGITRTAHGLRFSAAADATSGRGPFEILPSQILGKVIGSIPLVGYAFLFFGSLPGDVVLALLAGAGAGAGASYFLSRRATSPRASVERRAATPVESHERDDGLGEAETPGGTFPLSPTTAARVGEGPEEPDGQAVVLEGILAQAHEATSQSRANAAVLRELVGAISEYGVHLRSHTAVLQHLAATTDQLQAAAARLAGAVAEHFEARVVRPSREQSGHGSDMRAMGEAAVGAPAEAHEHLEQGAHRAVIDAEAWREPFTASELRHPNLPRTASRYMADTVDSLLDRAADALAVAERERNSLRDRLMVLEARLAILGARREPDRPPHLAQGDLPVRFTHAPPFANQPAAAFPAPDEPRTPASRPSPGVPPVWEVTAPPAP
jgi:signal peptidase